MLFRCRYLDICIRMSILLVFIFNYGECSHHFCAVARVIFISPRTIQKHFSISILRTNMMPKQFQLCALEGIWLIFDNNNGSSTVDKDNIFTIKCLFAWLIVGTALTSLLQAPGKKITIEKCRDTYGSSGHVG